MPPMPPHTPSVQDVQVDVQAMAQEAQDLVRSTAVAAESIDRFGRLSTDLANERTLLAWLRTAMAAIRTAFSFMDLSAGDHGFFWMSSVVMSRVAMITAILVATLTGIRRYSCVKQVTYMLYPPQNFGRLSIFWFNFLIVACFAVILPGMYLGVVQKN